MAILKTVFDAFPDDIKQVQILIDGNEVKTLAGHLNFRSRYIFLIETCDQLSTNNQPLKNETHRWAR